MGLGLAPLFVNVVSCKYRPLTLTHTQVHPAAGLLASTYVEGETPRLKQ